MVRVVVPLGELDRSMLAEAGGKAVNLGELLRAGFPVPPGVCVTTAAYARAAEHVSTLVSQVADAEPAERDALAQQLRERLAAITVPEDVSDAVRAAVAELGDTTPLAVRSSATAEDLPFASFAGQQDTFLNVVGADAVVDAIRRCWASLWTERAVAYRANNDIDQRTVRLAVVIQKLVEASAAGVLFTADPLTGRRDNAVVEAHAGLGEAVVSGAVNPDHWLVDARLGSVLDGPANGCLTPTQLLELTQLGKRVEALFGSPQDIEFAFDPAGKPLLVQSRAITTLYPVPARANPDDLRVYLSFNVAQGVFRPITPMGIEGFRLLGMGLSAAFGFPRTTPVLAEAGGRLFLDLTTPLRSPFWRRIVRFGLSQGEARSGVLIDTLLIDPRLAPIKKSPRRTFGPVLKALRTTRLPLRILAAWANPRRAQRSIVALRRRMRDLPLPPASASPEERLTAAERLLLEWAREMLLRVPSAMIGGLSAFALAYRLLGDPPRDEWDAVRRALPNNPTTEMDLALADLAAAARADGAARQALVERSPEELASAYAAGKLPPVLQRGLAAFLVDYGHRAIAEIDLGLPRWSDDPTPLLAHMASYLSLDSASPSPGAQFQAAEVSAQAALQSLVRRAAARGRLRGVAVRFLLRRGRALAGFREMPKFLVVMLLARTRALLLSVGRDLAVSGRLELAEDVFFLTFDEVRGALRGASVRPVVAERRARYDDELRRRHVPRLLLSDGTEPRPAVSVSESADDGQVLRGTPASAGFIEGVARVIMDPSGARLTPGEILVAPSTDPGWTPLFLTAGGLVMEMGGAMSHGAVVAREYGIPAVVGVPAATERIASGDTIVVDGSSGTVRRLS